MATIFVFQKHIKISAFKLHQFPSKLHQKNTSKQCIKITSIFRTLKLHRRKYVEMTWKFIDIFFSTYRHNINILDSTSIRPSVSVRNPPILLILRKNFKYLCWMGSCIIVSNVFFYLQDNFLFTYHWKKQLSYIYILLIINSDPHYF